MNRRAQIEKDLEDYKTWRRANYDYDELEAHVTYAELLWNEKNQ